MRKDIVVGTFPCQICGKKLEVKLDNKSNFHTFCDTCGQEMIVTKAKGKRIMKEKMQKSGDWIG
ncbi:MAG: hypothetical protein AB1629_04425 [Candidatus Omnitrophota bacterium]